MFKLEHTRVKSVKKKIILFVNCDYAIRLESSTEAPKKRHSRRRQARRQLSRTISMSEPMKARRHSTDDTSLEFPTSTDFTTETSEYIGHVHIDSKETVTVQPKTSTQNLSNRRHRRHHRRR